MTMLPVLFSLLLCAAPPQAKPAPEPGEAKFAAGQAAFGRGELEKAIVQLDAGAKEAQKAPHEPMLTRIHLLRGQCFAGMADNAKASEAFLKALEYDPAATLDPSAVRPSTIALLEKARQEARGELQASGDQPGEIYLDEQKLGPAPFAGAVAIGKHQVELRAADGRTSGKQEVLIKANRPTTLALSLPVEAAPPPPVAPPAPAEEPRGSGGLDLYADLRVAPQFRLDPGPLGTSFTGELGVGVGIRHVAASLHAGFAAKSFAATLRVTGRLPELFSKVGLHLSVDVPALFVNDAFVPGLGGAVGVDLAAIGWLEPFLELGARHYFEAKGVTTATTSLLVGAGARLRIP